ncbi:MAG: septation regulator SpoVG [Firmicutes bacterium]|nr:septation regulator SpoVG [Bacillota bacterium]
MLNITETRIRMVKTESEGKLKGVASITIDNCFVIHDLKIIEGGDGGLFVAMPSKKTPMGEYRDIVHPTNNEMRDKLKALILSEFEKAKEANT